VRQKDNEKYFFVAEVN